MALRRKLELNDLFALRAVGRPTIAPDNRRVVYELKRFDVAENRNFINLMFVDAEARRSRPLTRGKHVDSLPRFSPDGARLAFLSDRDKGVCLFVLEMEGGEPTRLTEPDGFVSDFAWSPDGRTIAYVYQPMSAQQKLERDGKSDEAKKQPQFKHITRLHHKLDGAGLWNGQYAHVWVISSDGGDTRQLTDGDYDDREPRWRPDGKLVSFLSNRVENPDLHYENADIYTVKPAGGGLKKVTQGFGPVAGHSWSPSGKQIAFIGAVCKPGEAWKHQERVWLVDSAGGRPRELVKAIDNPCRNLTLGDVATSGFEVAAPIWSSDAESIYFLVSERGACRLYSQGLRQGDLRCEVNGDVNIYHMQRTGADGPIALSIGTSTNPGDVFITDHLWRQHTLDKVSGWRPMNRSGVEGPTQLTHVNSAVLDAVGLPAPEEIIVKGGGASVHAWVFRPPNFDAAKKYPAILEIHGGPHTQVGHCFFHEKNWLAAQGYIVISGNPRGSAGYGLTHMNCIHADWGNRDYKDIMKLADWLLTRPYVNKRRVGVMGGSYGGFMTNWIIGHSNRFRAAVTQRSVVNLESMFGTSDFGYDLGQEFGGKPWEQRTAYRRMSPLSYVENMRTPLLIDHQEEDHRCPIEQGEQLFASLRVLGRTVEMIRFEGESHGMCRGGRPQNRGERLRRIADWFARHMKG
jgi:dipeptidyl aminopeptidase/acylaminoacyl peptidase